MTAKDPTAAWPPMPTYPIEHPDEAEPYKTNRILRAVMQERDAYTARLRDTAAALREVSAEYCCCCRGEDHCAHDKGRAILARLDKEGLT